MEDNGIRIKSDPIEYKHILHNAENMVNKDADVYYLPFITRKDKHMKAPQRVYATCSRCNKATHIQKRSEGAYFCKICEPVVIKQFLDMI